VAATASVAHDPPTALRPSWGIRDARHTHGSADIKSLYLLAVLGGALMVVLLLVRLIVLLLTRDRRPRDRED
jgi:hypothetical protein